MEEELQRQPQQQRSRRIGPSTCLILRPRTAASGNASSERDAAALAESLPSAPSFSNNNLSHHPSYQPSPSESSFTTTWQQQSAGGCTGSFTGIFNDMQQQQQCSSPPLPDVVTPRHASMVDLLGFHARSARRSNSSPGFPPPGRGPQDTPPKLTGQPDPVPPSDIMCVSPFSEDKLLSLFCTPTRKEDEDLARIMDVDVQCSPTKSTAFPLLPVQQNGRDHAALGAIPDACHQSRARGQLQFQSSCAPPPPPQQQCQHQHQQHQQRQQVEIFLDPEPQSPIDASIPASYPGSASDAAWHQQAQQQAAQAQRAQPPGLLLRTLMAMNRGGSHGVEADSPAAWSSSSRYEEEQPFFTPAQAPESYRINPQPRLCLAMEQPDVSAAAAGHWDDPHADPGTGGSFFLAPRPGERMASSQGAWLGGPPGFPQPSPEDERLLQDDEVEEWEWQVVAKRRCPATAPLPPPRMPAWSTHSHMTR